MSAITREVYEKNGGILQLIPTFVPRLFSSPGRRLRLAPDDYFALGTARGAIKERWFSSVITANNGPLAAADEGLSYVLYSAKKEDKLPLRDIVDEIGAPLIGSDLKEKYGTWPMYSKFFDYSVPLFHHLHLDFDAAQRIDMLGKPEAYYYPPQYNNCAGSMPVTYFGFDPDCTKDQVRERLIAYTKGDNRITELYRAYRIELGTGWYTPPGVVHAPGSFLTYEPQWNSDVNSVYENIATGEVYNRDFLVENLPANDQDNIDAIMDLMDWDANTDPHYKKHYFRPPITERDEGSFIQKWVVYGNPYIGAKELTVMPGQSITIQDAGAYGCILTQGHGKIGGYNCETAGMLRFGQLSADEFFVGHEAATQGVRITNDSLYEPLVMLKHFGPNHPDMP